MKKKSKEAKIAVSGETRTGAEDPTTMGSVCWVLSRPSESLDLKTAWGKFFTLLQWRNQGTEKGLWFQREERSKSRYGWDACSVALDNNAYPYCCPCTVYLKRLEGGGCKAIVFPAVRGCVQSSSLGCWSPALTKSLELLHGSIGCYTCEVFLTPLRSPSFPRLCPGLSDPIG